MQICQNMHIKYAYMCQNMNSICIHIQIYAQNMHKYAIKVCTIFKNMYKYAKMCINMQNICKNYGLYMQKHA